MSESIATIEAAAQEWNAEHPEEAVSVFACRFPGQFRDAADALRRVRKKGQEAPQEGALEEVS